MKKKKRSKAQRTGRKKVLNKDPLVAKKTQSRKSSSKVARKPEPPELRIDPDNIPEAITITDGVRILKINQACANMFGYEPEELAGMEILKTVAPESRESIRELMAHRTTELYEFIALRKDGATFPAEAIGKNFIYNGKPVRTAAIRDITARKAEEERQREAAGLFQYLLEDSPDAIAIVDLQGNYVNLSKANVKMLGYSSREEIIGKNVFGMFAPEDLERAKARFPQTIREKGNQNAEYKFMRKDGTIFVGEISTGIITDAQGSPKYVIGITRDVTERKRAEEAIREVAELYNSFMRASPDAVAIADLQGRYIGVSRKMLEMHGYGKPEEMLGKSVRDLIVPEDKEKTASRYHKLFERHEQLEQREYQLLRKNGSTFTGELNTAIVKDAHGKAKAVIGITRDITERKKNEQALKESRDFVDALVEMSPDAIVTTDLKGDLIRISRRTLELFGYSREEEMLGWHISHFLHQDEIERQKERFKLYEKSTVSFLSTYRYLRKDGSSFWGEVGSVQVRDAEGRPQYIIAVIRDITDRKKATEALHESMELYQNLLKTSPDGVAITDMEGNILESSGRLSEIFGVKEPESVIGKNVFDLAPKDQRENIKAVMHKVLEKGVLRNTELNLRSRDGSFRILESNAALLRDTHGAPKAFIGTMRDITERKCAEEKLFESEKKYRQLIEQAADGIFMVDPEGKISMANSRYCEMLGYEKEEIYKLNIFDTYPDNLKAEGRERLALVNKGQSLQFERPFKRKDGSIFQGEANVKKLDGGMLQTIVRDITERKKAQDAIRENMELYKSLVKASPDAVIITDLGANILELSELAVISQRVRSAGELIGRSAFDFMETGDHARAVEGLKKALEDGFAGPTELKMKRVGDGSSYLGEVNAALIRDSQGKPKALIATVRDITERRAMEDALRASEERFRTLVTSMDDVVFTLDREQRFVGIFGSGSDKNPVFKQGYLGKTVKEIYNDSDDSLRQKSIRRALEGQNVTYEWSLELPDQTIYLQTALSPIFGADGRVTGIVGVARNVTQIKKLEESLVKTEKLESLGILAGGIAHDFNNILTAIVGNISLAKALVRGEEKVYRSLDEAERAATRAKELTQQLLTFSRGGEPIKKPVSLGALLYDSCGFILRNSKSACEVSAPDDLWPVYADEGQLSQVFHNLLINADQAMPNGGKVDITCENMIIPGNNEWQLKQGKYVKICVRDNGVGIPREYLPKIFDPFFTTKQKGSGLGLAIIYSVISKHNGRISVESEPGVGTTFSIYLPASDESVQAQSAPEPEEQSLSRKLRILVMDDDEGIRRVAFNLLDYMGQEVSVAKDGEEAIELYQKAKDSGKPFDLLIMDLVVDNGMGGQEAMEILRRIDPQVKAMVSSGYSTDLVMSDFAKYGFIGVITKPYGINKLKEALRDILPKSGSTG